MKNITIIGTQGVPANYGGFESLVENIIGENKSPNINYTVFCSSKDLLQQISEYKGAKLKYIPLSANGVQSIPYDMLSLLKVPNETDVILILGVSGSLILPFFRLFSKKKLVVNIDGLEHRRDKWGKVARWFVSCVVTYLPQLSPLNATLPVSWICTGTIPPLKHASQ